MSGPFEGTQLTDLFGLFGGDSREDQGGIRTTDASDAYASSHNYYIQFTHIPTDQTATFKAFLTDYDDQYSSAWTDEDVYGRMDPISTFKGTRRQLSFAFDVVAGSKEEGESNYAESKKLISFLYPVYERGPAGAFSATSIQAPPLLKIKFANLISEERFGSTIVKGALVGKLSGLNYRPDFEVGFFDDVRDRAIPRVNRFSCNFTVFHTQNLGFDEEGRTDVQNEAHAREAEQEAAQAVQAEQAEAEQAAAEQRRLAEPALCERNWSGGTIAEANRANDTGRCFPQSEVDAAIQEVREERFWESRTRSTSGYSGI